MARKRALIDDTKPPSKKRKATDRKAPASVRRKNKPCRLLALPAELRTEIYEYVLLAPDDIVVTRRLRQPSLLRVNRQLRYETLAIWYQGNMFYHIIKDCDSRLLVAWTNHVGGVGLETADDGLCFRGKPNWANLMEWCQQICNGKATFSDTIDFGNLSKKSAVICAAMKMALEAANNSRPWRQCLQDLEMLRAAVGKFDGRWLQ